MPAPPPQPAISATALTASAAAELLQAVPELQRLAAVLLTEPPVDALWQDRLRALAQRLDELRVRAPDALLYLLLHGASRLQERYSSHHALVCAVVTSECATQLDWPEHEQRSLALAALSMNIGITALQDELVYRERTPTLDQRLAIDRHPARGRDMLAALGVTDPLWLGIVAEHHGTPSAGELLTMLEPAQRLARLLQRVDTFTAKVSPRQARKGVAPMQALHETYLANHGQVDEIGTALTRALGIYPPGSLVMLVNGETAIVLRRGERASQPIVACLIGADRQTLPAPIVRDTAIAGQQVKAASPLDASRLRLEHERLLTLPG